MLCDAASDMGLALSLPRAPGPTHFPRDRSKAPSVIDLTFVKEDLCDEISPVIEPDLRGSSDHAPLLTTVPLEEFQEAVERRVLPRDSEEEASFLSDASAVFRELADRELNTADQIEGLASAISDVFSQAWLCCSRERQGTGNASGGKRTSRLSEGNDEKTRNDCGQH